MPLDFSQLAARIDEMAVRTRASGRGREERLRRAVELLESADADALISKLASSNTFWPVAGIIDGLARRCKHSSCPEEYTAVAVDGSHIDVDRHNSTRFYLINTGSAVIRYGANPDAQLSSEAALFFGDDLAITDPSNGRKDLIEGALLGVRRSIAECRALADIASQLPEDRSTIALLDGSLVLWGLTPRDYEGYIREELLDRGYLGSFDIMKRRSVTGNFALAGYVSFPRSADVVNALRVLLCAHEAADCERCRAEGRERECEALADIQDSDLFDRLLEEGERSDIFLSGSKFVRKYYGEHQIYFFYLKVEDETARIEVPQWVAERAEIVDLVHALVLDQCRRGQGYPVALMEAHEKAVVTAADREAFNRLVEQSLASEGITSRSSGKSLSKRGRWV
ncbi:MAG: DNA double-strand break repair nuclease NurA [Chloroflexota bacterium]|nr:DNA double-strand break repair nuclease NurA [Chloroflexota bacterium]